MLAEQPSTLTVTSLTLTRSLSFAGVVCLCLMAAVLCEELVRTFDLCCPCVVVAAVVVFFVFVVVVGIASIIVLMI